MSNHEIRERDAKMWLLRRGDNLSLAQIAGIFGLSRENVRVRILLLDGKLCRGWKSTEAPFPGWYRRLRDAGALSRAVSSSAAYETFESTSPKAKRRTSQ